MHVTLLQAGARTYICNSHCYHKKVHQRWVVYVYWVATGLLQTQSLPAFETFASPCLMHHPTHSALYVMIPNGHRSTECGSCRDGLLRGELEACLMFTPPSELLIAEPLSSPSQKLLGSYITQSRALRSQGVSKSKYSEGGGLAAVTEFYGASGMFPSTPQGCKCALAYKTVSQKTRMCLAATNPNGLALLHAYLVVLSPGQQVRASPKDGVMCHVANLSKHDMHAAVTRLLVCCVLGPPCKGK